MAIHQKTDLQEQIHKKFQNQAAATSRCYLAGLGMQKSPLMLDKAPHSEHDAQPNFLTSFDMAQNLPHRTQIN